MPTRHHRRWSKGRIISTILTAAVLAFLIYYPLPYFLKTPGTAESVKARVSVDGQSWMEQGDFLFTTVLQHEKPNILTYLYVKLTQDYMETTPVRKVLGSISNVEAYNQLTDWMRVDSEASAVIAAHKYLNRPIEVEMDGVIIRTFTQNSPASKILHEGDIIYELDGQAVSNLDELAAALKPRQAGDKVTVKLRRGKRTLQETVTLTELVAQDGTSRAGFGFYHSQVRKARPSTPINFQLEDIGGPSAGLMLTLDIISKLEQKDYTRGRLIAGTGTIDAEGKVGQIGGIKFKLVAASKEGAEYFFVPKDVEATDRNQKDAEEFLKGYKTSMKLVPVSTLKEAADFLSALPAK